jgi:hypothetical protein
MSYRSATDFVVLHALRIKGFATTESIVEITGVPPELVNDHLAAAESSGFVRFREGRNLWQLTESGRDEHRRLLAVDNEASGAVSLLPVAYSRFLSLNDDFKQICTDWQVRGDDVNDHLDDDYDRMVIERLESLHDDASSVLADIGSALDRLEAYPRRLGASLERLRDGEASMFTGVMCGSYHDVWMELHEDLILTQGIDRAVEGSF